MNTEPIASTVTRTYRAAIRIGDDYITMEETVTLPIGASDDDVAQAVDLGFRVYQAQRAAVEAQVVSIREAAGAPPQITVRAPETPASEKQRTYIGTLQDSLGWTSEQLASYAHEQGVDLPNITKGQASTFIDGLIKLSDAQPAASTLRSTETRPARHGTFDYAHVRGRAVVPTAATSVSAVANADDDSDIPF